ncbi:hypothetical protein I315_05520 [Cryptococcus gattii Ru294]|nr:hypothetical protein I315_05520 [Cryptococcus gattii Ru294]
MVFIYTPINRIYQDRRSCQSHGRQLQSSEVQDVIISNCSAKSSDKANEHQRVGPLIDDENNRRRAKATL